MVVSGVLYTVPALALFALLIPFMGLGYGARDHRAGALFAADPDPQHRDRPARGARRPPRGGRRHGLRPWRRLWRIELPLALPVIVAGIRITVVTQISVATVAAYINAGGLGDIIFQGITQDFGEKVVVGAVVTSLLAIVADETLRLARAPAARRQAESV